MNEHTSIKTEIINLDSDEEVVFSRHKNEVQNKVIPTTKDQNNDEDDYDIDSNYYETDECDSDKSTDEESPKKPDLIKDTTKYKTIFIDANKYCNKSLLQSCIAATEKVGERYKCAICKESKEHNTRETLYRHIKQYHLGVKPECPVCGIQLTRRSLMHHAKKHHAVIIKYSYDTSSFKYAGAEKKIGDEYICTICPNSRKFARKKSVRRHIRYKHYGLSYKCPKCKRTYEERYALQKHLQENNCHEITVKVRKLTLDFVDNQYICLMCPDSKKFPSKYSIKKHRRLEHSTIKNKPKCTECLKEFPNKKQLNVHTKQDSHHSSVCRAQRETCIESVNGFDIFIKEEPQLQ